VETEAVKFSNMSPAAIARVKLVKQYVGWTLALNFAWEIVQLPLYSIWATGRGSEIAFAVVHCTAGDVLIALVSLLLATVIAADPHWPYRKYWRVAFLAMLFGVSYTVCSEWNNTVVTRSWSYAAAMPQILGIGLSPVAQWLAIPGLVFWRLFPALRGN
jgi:hypothetical protein